MSAFWCLVWKTSGCLCAQLLTRRSTPPLGRRQQKQGIDSSAPLAGPIILSSWNTLREKREVMPGPQVKTPLSGKPWSGSPAKRGHHCLLETVV